MSEEKKQTACYTPFNFNICIAKEWTLLSRLTLIPHRQELDFILNEWDKYLQQITEAFICLQSCDLVKDCMLFCLQLAWPCGICVASARSFGHTGFKSFCHWLIILLNINVGLTKVASL